MKQKQIVKQPNVVVGYDQQGEIISYYWQKDPIETRIGPTWRISRWKWWNPIWRFNQWRLRSISRKEFFESIRIVEKTSIKSK